MEPSDGAGVRGCVLVGTNRKRVHLWLRGPSDWRILPSSADDLWSAIFFLASIFSYGFMIYDYRGQSWNSFRLQRIPTDRSLSAYKGKIQRRFSILRNSHRRKRYSRFNGRTVLIKTKDHWISQWNCRSNRSRREWSRSFAKTFPSFDDT